MHPAHGHVAPPERPLSGANAKIVHVVPQLALTRVRGTPRNAPARNRAIVVVTPVAPPRLVGLRRIFILVTEASTTARAALDDSLKLSGRDVQRVDDRRSRTQRGPMVRRTETHPTLGAHRQSPELQLRRQGATSPSTGVDRPFASVFGRSHSRMVEGD